MLGLQSSLVWWHFVWYIDTLVLEERTYWDVDTKATTQRHNPDVSNVNIYIKSPKVSFGETLRSLDMFIMPELVLHVPSRSSGFWRLLIRAHVLQSPNKHWYILTGTCGIKLSWNTVICHVPKLGYSRKLLHRLLGGLYKSIVTKRVRNGRSGVRILAGKRFFFKDSNRLWVTFGVL